MNKTTVYLPESLKRGVERLARQRSCSEAEVIRQAIQDAVVRPKPRPGIIPGDSRWAEHVDEFLAGFGDR
ncbi:MAG: ribbon-helix-helix domain-containing protein [Acidimicrobiaceae bacterium]|nr:ribbon-helix-helix domain-containing protein [Acidimicrobiaceae bacterium]